MQLDQHDLVEAALLLEEQQHPQHAQQQSHNLGSSSFDVGMPDRSVAISGLGLEVELEDVRFGYQAERQVRPHMLCCAGVSPVLRYCGCRVWHVMLSSTCNRALLWWQTQHARGIQ
jgi:hypothetical protein